jgi:hypothetical protein
MCFGRKPSARSTPYSRVRSRTPMAMVLPRIIIMISRMITETMLMAVRMARQHGHEGEVHGRSLMEAVCMSFSSKMLVDGLRRWPRSAWGRRCGR